jgi:hypothetical protein
MYYYYDTNNNVTDIVEKRFVFPVYEEYKRRAWTYNQLNNIKSFRKYNWLAASAYWMPERSNQSQILYYYEGENTLAKSLNNASPDVMIYPNPAAGDWLNIAISNPQSTQIMLYDMQGRLLRHISPAGINRVFQLPLSGLASGEYIVRIINGNQEMTKTLSIAR